MKLTIRQLSTVLILFVILSGWAFGVSWFLDASWLVVFLSLVAGGSVVFGIHYYKGVGWMIKQMDARKVSSPALSTIAKKADLNTQPVLYITEPMDQANAFTVPHSSGTAIFITPKLANLAPSLLEPILAHELAHVKNGDSIVVGLISVFEQMIGNMGQLLTFLVFVGPLGWIVLFFFWPLLITLYAVSTVTLLIYQPIASKLMRQREFQADYLAAKWTSVRRMKKALKTIDRYNKGVFDRLFRKTPRSSSTHPSLNQRLRHLDQI